MLKKTRSNLRTVHRVHRATQTSRHDVHRLFHRLCLGLSRRKTRLSSLLHLVWDGPYYTIKFCRVRIRKHTAALSRLHSSFGVGQSKRIRVIIVKKIKRIIMIMRNHISTSLGLQHVLRSRGKSHTYEGTFMAFFLLAHVPHINGHHTHVEKPPKPPDRFMMRNVSPTDGGKANFSSLLTASPQTSVSFRMPGRHVNGKTRNILGQKLDEIFTVVRALAVLPFNRSSQSQHGLPPDTNCSWVRAGSFVSHGSILFRLMWC